MPSIDAPTTQSDDSGRWAEWWDSLMHDEDIPVLAAIAECAARRAQDTSMMRLLIAYAREVRRPHYSLDDLARASGLSISGVRTFYDAADADRAASLAHVLKGESTPSTPLPLLAHYDFSTPTGFNRGIPLGVNEYGAVVRWYPQRDPADDCHLHIVGLSGSGKSQMVRNIVHGWNVAGGSTWAVSVVADEVITVGLAIGTDGLMVDDRRLPRTTGVTPHGPDLLVYDLSRPANIGTRSRKSLEEHMRRVLREGRADGRHVLLVTHREFDVPPPLRPWLQVRMTRADLQEMDPPGRAILARRDSENGQAFQGWCASPSDYAAAQRVEVA